MKRAEAQCLVRPQGRGLGGAWVKGVQFSGERERGSCTALGYGSDCGMAVGRGDDGTGQAAFTYSLVGTLISEI